MSILSKLESFAASVDVHRQAGEAFQVIEDVKKEILISRQVERRIAVKNGATEFNGYDAPFREEMIHRCNKLKDKLKNQYDVLVFLTAPNNNIMPFAKKRCDLVSKDLIQSIDHIHALVKRNTPTIH